jgi:hypothetical protein
VDCECLICHEHHNTLRYIVDVVRIVLQHQSITVRNGYPEAQDYVFEWNLSRKTIQGREEELRHVTGSQGNSSMVKVGPVEAGNSGRAGTTDQGGRRT